MNPLSIFMPVSDPSLNISVEDLMPHLSFAHFEAIRMLPSFKKYIENLLNENDHSKASAAFSLLMFNDPAQEKKHLDESLFEKYLADSIAKFIDFQGRFAVAFSVYYSLKTCIIHDVNLSSTNISATPTNTSHDPLMRKVTLSEIYYGAMESDIKACEYYQITMRSFRYVITNFKSIDFSSVYC
jgi:hypothetical protein